VSYGSFNYDISGTKYTGDGGVVNLDGQLSSLVNYSLSISDGKFDDAVYNNSEGSVTYMILPNIGVDFMGSQIKLGTVQETDTSLGFSYNLFNPSFGIKLFAGSDINNYGKFYMYGMNLNLDVSQGSNLYISYKTEDRKQKATTMEARFVYDQTSNTKLPKFDIASSNCDFICWANSVLFCFGSTTGSTFGSGAGSTGAGACSFNSPALINLFIAVFIISLGPLIFRIF
jgi:hypothetical protein